MTDIQASTAVSMHKGSRERETMTVTALLIAIIREKPKASEAQHRAECKKMLLDPLYEDYLDNAINRILGLEYQRARDAVFVPTKEDLEAKARRRAEDKKAEGTKVDRVKDIIKDRIANLVLLDLVMANGKKLRDCTGYECTKLGGWLVEVGKKVGANKKVGDVLSEKAIAALIK